MFSGIRGVPWERIPGHNSVQMRSSVYIPGEDDPGDGLLLAAAADVVSPVEHPLAAADELLERGLTQLADVGVEGPQQRLGHRHPVLPGDPRRLGGRVAVTTQGNFDLSLSGMKKGIDIS